MDQPGETVLAVRERGRCRAGHSTSVRYTAMRHHDLPTDMVRTGSKRGSEYAWPPASVEEVIDLARQHGLETIGGQAQFRLPDGTCELYWVTVDPSKRKLGEPWDKWVNRSADEAIAKFRQRMAETNWQTEIQGWDFLREKAATGVDVMQHLCFVLYFGENPVGQSAAV